MIQKRKIKNACNRMENILGFDAGPALVDKANGVTRWRLNLGIINIFINIFINIYNIFLASFN